MRSIDSPTDDRTAKARIRDAAIGCFAEYGIAGTTARKVADAAGVSPGLVIHHFGSMDELRAACNAHVAATIRQQKEAALGTGPGLDPIAALRDSDYGNLAAYLARVLVDDSPAVADLVDELVADAEQYLEEGVASGMLRPTPDPKGRAVVLAMWSLGALVLHRHLDRLLSVDIADPGVGADSAIARYLAPSYEILGEGIFTDEFAEQARSALAAAATTKEGTK